MNNTRTLTRAAIIASLYAALTLLLAPISYGEIQIRLSESLTLLPVLLPEAVPALAIGCLLANILGGCTIFDIVFGTLATLMAAVMTRRLRNRPVLASAMPVLFNGVIVGAVVHFAYAPAMPLLLCMVFVAAGETVSCMVLGPAVLRVMRRLPSRLFEA
ncbi:MAG: QueT transporter family protein [Clostridia bacterium]|nr:QueT transporter family protein [Clostridia bacterium]MBQ7051883.1 QueT transporter family protein [Clostridia bacterium]